MEEVHVWNSSKSEDFWRLEEVNPREYVYLIPWDKIVKSDQKSVCKVSEGGWGVGEDVRGMKYPRICSLAILDEREIK